MADSMLTCVACGQRFNPTTAGKCDSCPLHRTCSAPGQPPSTACCPNCGTSNINPDASRLARWIASLFGGQKHDDISISS